jgi:hypothetical protein
VTPPTYPQVIAYGGLWIVMAVNVGLGEEVVAVGRYEAAALPSLVVAVCAVSQWLLPTVYAWLDAKRGEAVAERRMSEIALAQMEQQVRNGEVIFGLRMTKPGDRAN